MDTLVLLGAVTLGTPLIAGVIIALGQALEPRDQGVDAPTPETVDA